MRISKQEMIDYALKLEELLQTRAHCLYDTILAFGLREPQIEEIRRVAFSVSKRIKIFATDIISDLYGIPSFLIFADPGHISTDDLKRLYKFWKEDNTQKILFLSQPSVPVPKISKHRIKIMTNALDDGQDLKLMILNHAASLKKKEKNLRKHDLRIFRLLSIVKMLKKRQYLTIAEMAEEFNVSPRTAQRDINLLLELGEPIWYMDTKKAYALIDGKSYIWPD